MCVETMEQGAGSRSDTGRIEGSPEGGSTSSSVTRGDDGDLEASQDRNTTSEQEECTTVTDFPNTVNDNAGLQTTGSHEDLDDRRCNDVVSSEQGGGCLVPTEENASSEDLSCKTNDSIEGTVTGPSDQGDRPVVSTGNADNQQTSDDWTMVDHVKSEASTVGKGEECEKLKKNTELIKEECQKIAKVRNSINSDGTLRTNSLENNSPVVAKVSESEGEFAPDNEREDVQAVETDAQATREGSCDGSAASSQGLSSTPVAVEIATSEPDLVVSKGQGEESLNHPKSRKENLNLSKFLKEPLNHSKSLKETFYHSKSLKETVYHSKSLKETFNHSKSLKETSRSRGALSMVSISGAQKEIDISTQAPGMAPISEAHKEVGMNQGAPSTVSTSEALKEVGRSPEAPSTVSAYEAQEDSSVVSEAPSTELNSETQKVGTNQEASSMVSNSQVRKDVGISSETLSTLSTSEAREEISESSEALSMVSNSEVHKEVGISSDAPSTVSASEAQEESSVISDAPSMVSASEAQEESNVISDAPSTVAASEAQEESSVISEAPSTVLNSEVKKDVGINSEDPSRVLVCKAEEETSVSSGAPSRVSTSEAQKDIGISDAEDIMSTRTGAPSRVSAPEGLQRKASQIGKEETEDLLQEPPQQSQITVTIHEGVLQARSEEGKETSASERDVRESDHSQTSTLAFCYEEKLAQRGETIAELDKKAKHMEARKNYFRGKLQGLEQQYDELYQNYRVLASDYQELERKHKDLDRAYKEKETECARHLATAESYGRSYGKLKMIKESAIKENEEKDKLVRDLRVQLEQTKKESSNLQNQMSLYEQQHANEQSRGGSYLDDTKAATPALLVSALNGVKDASNNFVKVLRSSLQPGIEAQLNDYIGAVSRSGHIKFQYQAYVCRVLLGDFHLPYAGSSKVVLPPTSYFRQYQMHDLKKTDTVERLLQNDLEINPSLQDFCFDKFSKLIEHMHPYLIDRSIDLKQQIQSRQHPRGSKLYVSFCKLAVSVWLLHRLAFSFLHPAKPFGAQSGEPFDLNRMQSVVPLDDPASDEELQLKVGFYVLPGFDVGNSAIPCEVYVALK